MKIMIELFSGSGDMSEAFAKMGFRTFEVDFDESMNPDKVADILELLPADLPKNPYVIWASPDCTYFSLANNKGRHFAKGGEPISEQAKHACRVVERTIWRADSETDGYLGRIPSSLESFDPLLSQSPRYANRGNARYSPEI